MIKVERNSKYKTFYWPAKSDVYDTERDITVNIKVFGISIYKNHKVFNAEYFEHEKRIGGFKLIGQ